MMFSYPAPPLSKPNANEKTCPLSNGLSNFGRLGPVLKEVRNPFHAASCPGKMRPMRRKTTPKMMTSFAMEEASPTRSATRSVREGLHDDEGDDEGAEDGHPPREPSDHRRDDDPEAHGDDAEDA